LVDNDFESGPTCAVMKGFPKAGNILMNEYLQIAAKSTLKILEMFFTFLVFTNPFMWLLAAFGTGKISEKLKISFI
jgi:hypothetical protein